MMKLVQRMIKTVCVNMSTSNGQSWTALSDSPDDPVRITTRKVTDPGQPIGVILTAVSTIWLPYSHYYVFELLREERRRAQLNVLTTVADHGSSSPDQNHESSIMNTGYLLTVGLQVLANTSPSAKLNLSSVTVINNHLCNSVQQIISALGSGNICITTTTTTTTTDNGSGGDASGGSDHPIAASLRQ